MQIPLTPNRGGGQSIDSKALQVADIIVSTTDAAVSKVIKFETLSAVSHAMLYVGNDHIIDATGELGVMRRTLQSAVGDATLAVAYRRSNVTEANGRMIARHAEKFLGRAYDTSGAAGAGIARQGVICVAAGIAAHFGAFNSEEKFFCSELVLEAFRLAGVPLVKVTPQLSTPQTIVEAHSDGILEYVGHLIT